MLSDTSQQSQPGKKALLLDVALMAGVAPKDYVAATAVVLWLPAVVIYCSTSKTLEKSE